MQKEEVCVGDHSWDGHDSTCGSRMMVVIDGVTQLQSLLTTLTTYLRQLRWLVN